MLHDLCSVRNPLINNRETFDELSRLFPNILRFYVWSIELRLNFPRAIDLSCFISSKWARYLLMTNISQCDIASVSARLL